jgi:hypothetical protein
MIRPVAVAVLVSSLALSACAPTVVTDYNGDSIRIQSSTASVTSEALNEARRICATRGLQAEYASTQSSPTDLFLHRHLFLCLSRTKPNYGLPSGQAGQLGYLENTATL